MLAIISAFREASLVLYFQRQFVHTGDRRKKLIPLPWTPLSLAEQESLPAQEGAAGGKAARVAAQLTIGHCWMPMSI